MTVSWFAVFCLVATIALSLGTEDKCQDADGNVRQLNEKWEEGVDTCECIRRQSLFYFDIGTDEVTSYCQLNGCPTDETKTEVVKAGETFTYEGDSCTCMEGTSPFLADISTLYHGKCGLRYVDFFY